MKTFTNQAAQGDLLITRIEKLPDGLGEAKSDNGHFVLAHSETGHNHVLKAENARMFYPANDNFVAYLVVDKPSPVEHLRSFDTHESIEIPAGIWEIRRQREYIPEGFRRAAD